MTYFIIYFISMVWQYSPQTPTPCTPSHSNMRSGPFPQRGRVARWPLPPRNPSTRQTTRSRSLWQRWRPRTISLRFSWSTLRVTCCISCFPLFAENSCTRKREACSRPSESIVCIFFSIFLHFSIFFLLLSGFFLVFWQLQELDAEGNVLGAGGNAKHSFNSFATQEFTFGSPSSTTYKGGLVDDFIWFYIDFRICLNDFVCLTLVFNWTIFHISIGFSNFKELKWPKGAGWRRITRSPPLTLRATLGVGILPATRSWWSDRWFSRKMPFCDSRTQMVHTSTPR